LSTLSKALSDVRLQAIAEGTVHLEPNEISLAKGQTISIDSNSRLRMDPAAKVIADGEIRVQIPSVATPESMTTRVTQKRPIITKFTVFKSVPFGRGSIQTGWNFLTSAQGSPTDQYCYYIEHLEGGVGGGVSLEIAVDQKLDPPKTLPKGFDIGAAFNRCVWFKPS